MHSPSRKTSSELSRALWFLLLGLSPPSCTLLPTLLRDCAPSLSLQIPDDLPPAIQAEIQAQDLNELRNGELPPVNVGINCNLE